MTPSTPTSGASKPAAPRPPGAGAPPAGLLEAIRRGTVLKPASRRNVRDVAGKKPPETPADALRAGMVKMRGAFVESPAEVKPAAVSPPAAVPAAPKPATTPAAPVARPLPTPTATTPTSTPAKPAAVSVPKSDATSMPSKAPEFFKRAGAVGEHKAWQKQQAAINVAGMSDEEKQQKAEEAKKLAENQKEAWEKGKKEYIQKELKNPRNEKSDPKEVIEKAGRDWDAKHPQPSSSPKKSQPMFVESSQDEWGDHGIWKPEDGDTHETPKDEETHETPTRGTGPRR